MPLGECKIGANSWEKGSPSEDDIDGASFFLWSQRLTLLITVELSQVLLIRQMSLDLN